MNLTFDVNENLKLFFGLILMQKYYAKALSIYIKFFRISTSTNIFSINKKIHGNLYLIKIF